MKHWFTDYPQKHGRSGNILWHAPRGNTRCNLTSPETARRFYLANGYVEDSLPVGNFGMSSGHPMSKIWVSPDWTRSIVVKHRSRRLFGHLRFTSERNRPALQTSSTIRA
jgi:hypothetical protein